MHLPREALLSFALSVTSFGATTFAQPATAVSPDADRAAREHFTRGREAFSQGDFATAVREFSQAYELSGRPQLLYNIGTTYERLHNWQEANLALTRYLERVPDAPDRAEVQARLNVIQVELQHLAEARQTPEPATHTNTRVVVIERQVQEPPRYFRTAAIVAGGLAVVGGGVTLAVGLLADRRYNDLASGCGQTVAGCPQVDIEDMQLRQSFVNGGLVASGVFAAAAVTFFLLDQFRPARPPVGPIPASAPPTARADFAPLPGGGVFSIVGSM
jgi:tetratricopeptide (TPR) repeat protein